jgi:hypothetical protein
MSMKDFEMRLRDQRYAVFAALLAVSLVLSFLITNNGLIVGLGAIAMLIGGIVLVFSFVNLQFGVLFLLSISFFLQGVNRFSELPLGVINDTFVMVLTFGMIVQNVRKGNFKIPTDALSLIIFAWVAYNVLEVLNPAGNIEGWLHGVRGLIMLSPFFFVVRYVSTRKFVETLIHTWLFFALLAALYGLYQEFVGLLPFEKQWVMADPFRFKLLFNWGRFRIFSFFPDAALCGILMAYSSLLAFILAIETNDVLRKIVYFTAGLLMAWVLIYTGTRTAFVILPAAFGFYCILTFKKGPIAAMTAGGLLLAFIIFTDVRSLGPLTTNSLNRIRSAFAPTDDRSYQTRMYNQARIQPYIQSHPFGGGVGSSGLYGYRFNQASELASFSPDSGFVRAAVELGWVGLIIYCTMYFLVLRRGIIAYFNLRDPQLKGYCAALVSVAFCLILANFPQQSMTQVPTLLIFYAVMGMLSRIDELEQPIENKL